MIVNCCCCGGGLGRGWSEQDVERRRWSDEGRRCGRRFRYSFRSVIAGGDRKRLLGLFGGRSEDDGCLSDGNGEGFQRSLKVIRGGCEVSRDVICAAEEEEDERSGRFMVRKKRNDGLCGGRRGFWLTNAFIHGGENGGYGDREVPRLMVGFGGEGGRRGKVLLISFTFFPFFRVCFPRVWREKRS